MARRGEPLEVGGRVLVRRAPGAEAGVADLARDLAELGGVGQLGRVVEVRRETELGVEAFEKSGQTGDVGPWPREHDHAGGFEIRGP
jgi:hypothetical protein